MIVNDLQVHRQTQSTKRGGNTFPTVTTSKDLYWSLTETSSAREIHVAGVARLRSHVYKLLSLRICNGLIAKIVALIAFRNLLEAALHTPQANVAGTGKTTCYELSDVRRLCVPRKPDTDSV